MDAFSLILAGNEWHTLCLFHDDDLPLMCMGDKVFDEILLYGVAPLLVLCLGQLRQRRIHGIETRSIPIEINKIRTHRQCGDGVQYSAESATH